MIKKICLGGEGEGEGSEYPSDRISCRYFRISSNYQHLIQSSHITRTSSSFSAIVQMSRTLLMFVYITTIDIDVNVDAIDVMIGIIVVQSLLNY